MDKRSSFRRSQTFQPTIHSAPLMVANNAPQRRSLSIDEFPTSPDQSILGEEMYHFSHSHHPIALVNLQDPFTCSGCKEHGAGKRFSCLKCDFQLHDFCALSPPVLKAHPFHVQHQLVFHSKPKTGKQQNTPNWKVSILHSIQHYHSSSIYNYKKYTVPLALRKVAWQINFFSAENATKSG